MSSYIGLERSWIKLLRGAGGGEPLSNSFSIFSKDEGVEDVERSGAWLERGKGVPANSRGGQMERENGHERERERERESGGWSNFKSHPSGNQTNVNSYSAVNTANSGIRANDNDGAAYSAYRPVFNDERQEEGDRERDRDREERQGTGTGAGGEMKRSKEDRRDVAEHKSGPSGPSTSSATSTSSAQQIAATALQSIASMLPFKTDTHTNTNTNKNSDSSTTNLERQMIGNNNNNEIKGNKEDNSTSRQNGDEETVTF